MPYTDWQYYLSINTNLFSANVKSIKYDAFHRIFKPFECKYKGTAQGEMEEMRSGREKTTVDG